MFIIVLYSSLLIHKQPMFNTINIKSYTLYTIQQSDNTYLN